MPLSDTNALGRERPSPVGRARRGRRVPIVTRPRPAARARVSVTERVGRGRAGDGVAGSAAERRAVPGHFNGNTGARTGHSETLSRVFEAGETSRLSNEDKTTFLTQI